MKGATTLDFVIHAKETYIHQVTLHRRNRKFIYFLEEQKRKVIFGNKLKLLNLEHEGCINSDEHINTEEEQHGKSREK